MLEASQQGWLGFASRQRGPTEFQGALERAGMSTLSEGQKLSFEVVADRRSGKSAAENLRSV
jgi:CspA family cold shock protein